MYVFVLSEQRNSNVAYRLQILVRRQQPLSRCTDAVYRAHRRTLKDLSSKSALNSRTRTLLALLVESGAGYSVLWVSRFPANPHQFLTQCIMMSVFRRRNRALSLFPGQAPFHPEMVPLCSGRLHPGSTDVPDRTFATSFPYENYTHDIGVTGGVSDAHNRHREPHPFSQRRGRSPRHNAEPLSTFPRPRAWHAAFNRSSECRRGDRVWVWSGL